MTDDRDRLEAELQEIAEDYVLHWLGETDSKAVRSLYLRLRHQKAEGMRMVCEILRGEFRACVAPSLLEEILNQAAALDEGGEKGE